MPSPSPGHPGPRRCLAAVAGVRYPVSQAVTLPQIAEASGISVRTTGTVRRWARSADCWVWAASRTRTAGNGS